MNASLIPIHTEISGRARFKIKSLPRSPELRQQIGHEVRRLPGVNSAHINAVTDSLLVLFDRNKSWRAIAGEIAKVIEDSADVDPASTLSATGGAGESSQNLPSFSFGPSGVACQWQHLEASRVLEWAGSSIEKGLLPESAEHRIRIHGSNIIPEAQSRSRAEILKDQFKFLPMALLLAESVVAMLGGAPIDAGLLATITGVNLLVGYLIDRRAEQALAAFKHRPRPPALVLRGGAWVELPGEKLVIGDVIMLASGTYVGADCRIIEAAHLKIDESILTGESNPVDKHADIISDGAAHLFDQRNMAFMGTLVVGGEGIGVVVATGPRTEFGKLNALFEETIPPQTPVIAKIHALSGALLKMALAAGGGVFLVGLLRGRGLLQALGRAAFIAAAAVPAGLLSAATVNMAVGVKRLRSKNVSIRRLYSLESLSAVQMICFDKTGTLTRSRIDVQRIYCSGKAVRVHQRGFWLEQELFSPLQDPDFHRLLLACVLCSESRLRLDPLTGRRKLTGSPTEVALLHLAMLASIDLDESYRRHPLKRVQHRGDARRYMVTVHAAPGGRSIVFTKGDPSEVLDLCTWQLRGGKRAALSETDRNAIEIQNQRMAGEALRVLGFACRTLEASPDEQFQVDELTWVGLVGMAEPIRAGVVALIDRLHQAGIQTVMITGDQSTTAETVARRVRLGGRSEIRIFDSSRLDTLTPELASALIRDVQVFARIDPAQKLGIVHAYQHRGMVVAMTGDGINDGPALRAADVGIAMGLSGTDAAREVADMVLERDNISSIHAAVLEGRAAYRNLKRALRYFISTNFSDMLLVTAATIAPGADLIANLPVQVDLLTDLTPGLALLMEPASPDIGYEPPRDREEPLFSTRDMLSLFSESAVMSGGALAALAYGLLRYGPGSKAATLAFETLSAAKVLHALTCRPWMQNSESSGRRFGNPHLSIAVAATLLAQAATILIPGLRRILNIAPLNATDLAVAGLTALATRIINNKIREDRRNESKIQSVANLENEGTPFQEASYPPR